MKRVSQKDLQNMYEAPSSKLEERIHQTIASLPVQVQEGKVVKRKWFMSAVLALVLILAVGAIGLAGSGIFGNRTVDFDGNITESEGVTDVQVQELQTEYKELMKIYEKIPDGDLGVIYNDEGQMRSMKMSRVMNNWEEFEKAIAGVDYLTVPERFPEGLELEKAEIYLACRPGGEYRLADEITEGEYTLKRYTVDDVDKYIDAYLLQFRDSVSGEKKLQVASQLSTALPMNFGIDEEDTAEAVSIPGMDNALLFHFTEEDLWALEMRRKLEKPIAFEQVPGDDLANQFQSYTEEYLEIRTADGSISPDTLTDMMQMGK